MAERLEKADLDSDPVGKNQFDSSGCDVAKSLLAKSGVPYASVDGSTDQAEVFVGDSKVVDGGDPAAFRGAITAAVTAAGYPSKADPARIDKPKVVGILFVLVLLVTMVYGPIAALLVEYFPSRIRYTSMSLPYHIGNGWFGGFLPATAFAMVAATGDIYYGLWYPVIAFASTGPARGLGAGSSMLPT